MTDAITQPEVIETKSKVKCPAGTYYVGDPCYAVSHDTNTWDEYLSDSDFFRTPIAHAKNGSWCVAFSTAYGDGGYYDENDPSFEYGVDAGLLGVVPEVWAEVNALWAMKKVTFDAPFTCYYEEDCGVVVLGHIRIVTDPDDDEYDDFYIVEDEDIAELEEKDPIGAAWIASIVNGAAA